LRKYTGEKFVIKEIEVADREVFSFLAAYILPLVFGQQENPDPYILGIVILIFGAVILISYSYHFNPILSLLGWHFYRVKNANGVQYILLTKNNLRSYSLETQAIHLTDYIMLEKH
jgi:hypothetical protein